VVIILPLNHFALFFVFIRWPLLSVGKFLIASLGYERNYGHE
jgi:hypothetical protein